MATRFKTGMRVVITNPKYDEHGQVGTLDIEDGCYTVFIGRCGIGVGPEDIKPDDAPELLAAAEALIDANDERMLTAAEWKRLRRAVKAARTALKN